jgi:hypothetical protein
MNAIGPGSSRSGSYQPVARSLRSTFTKPMQFPPQIAILASRAITASRSVSGGTPSRGSSKPLA